LTEVNAVISRCICQKNPHYYRSLFGDVPIDESFNELSRLGFTEEVFEIFEENDKWQE
jgi:hypothetical protein